MQLKILLKLKNLHSNFLKKVSYSVTNFFLNNANGKNISNVRTDMSFNNQINSNMKHILYSYNESEYRGNYSDHTPAKTRDNKKNVPSFSDEQNKQPKKLIKAFKFLFYIHNLKYFKFQIFLNSNFLTTN